MANESVYDQNTPTTLNLPGISRRNFIKGAAIAGTASVIESARDNSFILKLLNSWIGQTGTAIETLNTLDPFDKEEILKTSSRMQTILIEQINRLAIPEDLKKLLSSPNPNLRPIEVIIIEAVVDYEVKTGLCAYYDPPITPITDREIRTALAETDFSDARHGLFTKIKQFNRPCLNPSRA